MKTMETLKSKVWESVKEFEATVTEIPDDFNEFENYICHVYNVDVYKPETIKEFEEYWKEYPEHFMVKSFYEQYLEWFTEWKSRITK